MLNNMLIILNLLILNFYYYSHKPGDNFKSSPFNQ